MHECWGGLGLSDAILPNAMRHEPETIAALCDLIAAHRREYPARSILRLEGDETEAVYFVLSGWIVVSKSLSNGQRQIIDVVLPGGIIDPGSADPVTCAAEIEALTDVSAAAIPRARWLQACGEHRELADLASRAIVTALSRISERMLRLGKAPAETRVAFALCELCLRSSAQGLVQDAVFHIPMTQQKLGELCGLSSVHICRTLRRFERNGVLSVTDHMDIVVHKMDALAEIAEIDPEALRNVIIPPA